jgi:hypothetical protein
MLKVAGPRTAVGRGAGADGDVPVPPRVAANSSPIPSTGVRGPERQRPLARAEPAALRINEAKPRAGSRS